MRGPIGLLLKSAFESGATVDSRPLSVLYSPIQRLRPAAFQLTTQACCADIARRKESYAAAHGIDVGLSCTIVQAAPPEHR
eukprot:11755399-Alexandrium_andersonii.AAC.1